MQNNLLELFVAVPGPNNRTKIPEYGHNGLTFVEGRHGQPYSLRLQNNSPYKTMAVISIDGLCVVDGTPCTEQSRGYIIPAYSGMNIDGWRTSLQEVRQFTFETKEHSYAKGSTGDVRDCGVIAAKFFSEKPKPVQPRFLKWAPPEEHHHHHHHHHHEPPVIWPVIKPGTPFYSTGTPLGDYYTSMMRCSTDSIQGSAKGQDTLGASDNSTTASCAGESFATASFIGNVSAPAAPEFNMGTGFGEAKIDRVAEAAFEVDRELCTLVIYYADAAALTSAGINLNKRASLTCQQVGQALLPQPFHGFCQPPR